ncbi:MAG TPA: DUF4162 domain-containing protein, partial [Acidimicrobiia bacterium]|nr:DUF4162 domain-containing protein [Acidimicrobiia bacterium]
YRTPGVSVADVAAGSARLVLSDGLDSQVVLAAAMAAGRVVEFGFERRKLSEIFREAVECPG